MSDKKQYRTHGIGNAVQTAEEYAAYIERTRQRMDREHNVIQSLVALSGWDIVQLLRWKSGVVQFHARRGLEFQMGYAKDEIFAPMQLPK